MADRPSLPTARGRVADTEDDVADLTRRVFVLERTIAELTARLAVLEATP